MNSFKSKFGKRIKELRKKAGYTQEKLAEKIGIEPPNISKIENGIHFPQTDKLEKFAKAFNLDVMDLFELDEPKDPDTLLREIYEYLETTDVRNIEFVHNFINILRKY